MKFRETQLENGLQIVAECNSRAYAASLGFFVNTGSRDETDEISGVSHFLEHMVFKGTSRRTAADVNRELDEIGSHSNAFTAEENTVYFATVLPEYQDRALDLLSDIMRPSLRNEDFETEKQVILEEIYKYDDQPPYGAHEKCMEAYFQGHPLGRNILGTVESVSGLTCESMHRYFQQRYSPGNITLVATGNVDFDRLVENANLQCGDWEPFETQRTVVPSGCRQDFHVIHKASATQQYVVQISDGPDAMDVDRYAARVLATILGDDGGSQLFWELVETGRAEFVGVGNYEFEGAGILMTYLSCAPERAADNLCRIRDVFLNAERNGITSAELKQAQSKISSHIVLANERSSNRLFVVGSNWLQRRDYRTVREVIDSYEAVSCDDAARILSKFPLSRNTAVAVGPLETLQIAEV